jgi:hypothetical protein
MDDEDQEFAHRTKLPWLLACAKVYCTGEFRQTTNSPPTRPISINYPFLRTTGFRVGRS